MSSLNKKKQEIENEEDKQNKSFKKIDMDKIKKEMDQIISKLNKTLKKNHQNFKKQEKKESNKISNENTRK